MVSLSLPRKGAIFRDEIENNFSCSHLLRRDRDYHMTILVIRDESRITYFCSPVSRRDRDLRKSFLVVEQEKNEAFSRREFPGSKILVELCVGTTLERPKTAIVLYILLNIAAGITEPRALSKVTF